MYASLDSSGQLDLPNITFNRDMSLGKANKVFSQFEPLYDQQNILYPVSILLAGIFIWP